MGTPSRIAEAIVSLDPCYNRLTPHNTAILLIDYQIGPLWELEFSGIRRSAADLARLANRLRLPTVITAIAPEIWGPVIPEITDAFPSAPVIVRAAVNAWDEPPVRRAVESVNREKLLIAGGAGEVDVTQCALSAAESGYEVYAPIDGCAELGNAALARLCRGGVIVTTTSLIAAEIMSESRERGV